MVELSPVLPLGLECWESKMAGEAAKAQKLNPYCAEALCKVLKWQMLQLALTGKMVLLLASPKSSLTSSHPDRVHIFHLFPSKEGVE